MQKSDKIIILIVGASGVGKDSLLKQFINLENINIVKRYITRVADENEDNYYLSKKDFLDLKNADFFISSWFAHDNFYGISKNSLNNKINIISVSRTVIDDFENMFNNVFTINITLNKSSLKQRLLKRGRESIFQIENRLKRVDFEVKAKNLITFENDKPIVESAKNLIYIIEKLSKG
ncbi:hypothetical protein CPU12_06990 [Malaciobacter molluscorum LMG 25693]|uniref:Ribose 1,5-bisphosphate phosphokinase n=1 Tax=Malaciobacter molluscorum LMG 25693 TaxID=870501 RepID=A0A2G1DIF6_9BACT|nr:hypothetical protein [Malaciobacter molluscorum]AXX92345.1 ribose 1,5-bisphosphate phosphokinase [Malaciobacter molluscorum LMG 25693]PHO18204.1 hypothetical protein CPU12_06990 [Malaciobacter molluscorum LMG 25693]